MELKDLTGRRFGRLTVIKHSHIANNVHYWICKCDCGNERIASGSNLQQGYIKSCGCLKKEGFKNAFIPQEIQLKERHQLGGEVKKYKLSQKELEKYLKELETKEVQYRK